MRKRRIETGTHYAPAMHKQPVYRNNVIAGNSLPVTEQVARELIALPVSHEMDDNQIDYVLTAIEDLF
jgi:dTDP-4-amino-4,6-dideoxygalactose transaminase